MTAQQPPQKADANLAASDKTCSDSRSATSTCPLMKTKLQLLPLRYGLVEDRDPSTELSVPYKLQARPLGIRLIRDGYLYVIDATTQQLHEYQLVGGSISQQLFKGTEVKADVRTGSVGEPNLVFPRLSTLYVAYSELQWTARKCSQVLKSQDERSYFMQRVTLATADPEKGAADLLTRKQAENWLEEVYYNGSIREGEATPLRGIKLGPYPIPEEEGEPYLWETPKRFRTTQIGELTAQILPEYEHDALFLVVRDDIGVMRDLAEYQDQVVAWLDTWAQGGAQPGANERDYLLACYIESITQLHPDQLPKTSADSDTQTMFDELYSLPEPEQGQTRQALLDYLNGAPLPQPMDPATPAPLRKPAEQQHTRAAMASADPDFVDVHLETLIKLKKDRQSDVYDQLKGAKLGQRGINDLIDRPSMDSFLKVHRYHLDRWHTLLAGITADRQNMLTNDRFHRAAWYYDLEQAKQVGQAFTTEYACLRDICRSDSDNEQILAWLDEKPEYSRPLFYTLALSERTQLLALYASINSAGYNVVINLSALKGKLAEAEKAARLPVLDELPESTRVVALSAQHTISPALALGIADVMEAFYKTLNRQQAPDLDELFRKLPKALSVRLLDAALTEGVTFKVATEAEKLTLRNDIRDVLATRAELKSAVTARKQAKASAGHKSVKARALLAEIKRLGSLLDELEPRLAAALSPITELPDASVRIAAAAPGRAGVTLILPAAQQSEVAGLMHSLRNGYAKAPAINVLGDGIGVAVFVAQFVNLAQVWRELLVQPEGKENWLPFFSALSATSAAGFAAAQAVADTALSVRSGHLAQALQSNALENVHVQMGKLHTALGGVAYFSGLIAAGFGAAGHHAEWLSAVRQGNGQAQLGATTAMLGSAGLVASNAYGLGNTAIAMTDVFKNIGNIELRRAAWSAAGARLSTVFFRFNIAGAIFTAIEWGGTYWYNRNNTTPHDKWLQTTPWSKDAAKRQYWPMQVYQERLRQIAQAPSVTVAESSGSWLSNVFSKPKGGRLSIVLPGLSKQELSMPLAGKPSARLSISAYRINIRQYDKGPAQESWAPVTEDITDSLLLSSAEPLQLELLPLAEQAGSLIAHNSHELMLLFRIEQLDAKTGLYSSQQHSVRFSPSASGSYPSTTQTPRGAAAIWSPVDTLLLPEAANADKQ